MKFSLIEIIALSIIPIRKAEAGKWSYTGETGADFWGELDPEFQACNLGQAQSPIDLESSVNSNPGSFELNYQDTPLKDC